MFNYEQKATPQEEIDLKARLDVLLSSSLSLLGQTAQANQTKEVIEEVEKVFLEEGQSALVTKIDGKIHCEKLGQVVRTGDGERKYTEEDMRKAWQFAAKQTAEILKDMHRSGTVMFEDYILSLNK